MSDQWQRWEGYVVDGRFPLHRYLGGTAESAVFETQLGEGEAQTAAIKLLPAASLDSGLQLSRWARAAKLAHPNLVRLLHFGTCELDGEGVLYAVTEYAS